MELAVHLNEPAAVHDGGDKYDIDCTVEPAVHDGGADYGIDCTVEPAVHGGGADYGEPDGPGRDRVDHPPDSSYPQIQVISSNSF